LFQQAKTLEELDAEFGVGDLVEDEMRNERREAYSFRDLRGLRVEHAVVSVMLVWIFCYIEKQLLHDVNVFLCTELLSGDSTSELSESLQNNDLLVTCSRIDSLKGRL
jgi:hypothetical protein